MHMDKHTKLTILQLLPWCAHVLSHTKEATNSDQLNLTASLPCLSSVTLLHAKRLVNHSRGHLYLKGTRRSYRNSSPKIKSSNYLVM